MSMEGFGSRKPNNPAEKHDSDSIEGLESVLKGLQQKQQSLPVREALQPTQEEDEFNPDQAIQLPPQAQEALNEVVQDVLKRNQ